MIGGNSFILTNYTVHLVLESGNCVDKDPQKNFHYVQL